MNRAAQTEGVIVIMEDGEPKYIVRKNGEVVYYKLEKMGFGDHSDLWGAENIQS